VSFVLLIRNAAVSVKSRFLSFPSDWPRVVRDEVTGRPKGPIAPHPIPRIRVSRTVEDKLGTAELSVIGARDGGYKSQSCWRFLFFVFFLALSFLQRVRPCPEFSLGFMSKSGEHERVRFTHALSKLTSRTLFRFSAVLPPNLRLSLRWGIGDRLEQKCPFSLYPFASCQFRRSTQHPSNLLIP